MTELLDRTKRAAAINAELSRLYPDAQCELDFSNPLELTVATVLSAQCTDERVNKVTPELFRKYPTAADYARADRAELEEILRPLGFQRSKAKHLIGMGEVLMGDFEGRVPEGIDKLQRLPGVGRKTAQVVRGDAFGIPGLTVDTHFQRLMRRLDLSQASTPRKMEDEIAQLIPQREWTIFSHRVISHGRRVCTARKPKCGACSLAPLCPGRQE